MLRPIATPLVMGGFARRRRQSTCANGVRGAAASTPMAGAVARRRRAPSARRHAPPLAPGDAVGVGLVDGDLSLGATGTVTDVDGDRVYAFGHPFYNLGPTTFPMTRAYVHVVLPSLMSSSKLATLGEVIGTVRAGSRDGHRRHARRGALDAADARWRSRPIAGRAATFNFTSSATSCSRRC